jgi:hypothetical protein
MTAPSPALVDTVRAASRQLVREFGFLDRTIAGTDLSGSGVHAIMEIGLHPGITAKELCARLKLEKSTVSRLLKSLEKRGDIQQARSDERRPQLHAQPDAGRAGDLRRSSTASATTRRSGRCRGSAVTAPASSPAPSPPMRRRSPYRRRGARARWDFRDRRGLPDRHDRRHRGPPRAHPWTDHRHRSDLRERGVEGHGGVHAAGRPRGETTAGAWSRTARSSARSPSTARISAAASRTCAGSSSRSACAARAWAGPCSQRPWSIATGSAFRKSTCGR